MARWAAIRNRKCDLFGYHFLFLCLIIRCLKSSRKQAKTALPPYPYFKEAAQNLIYDRFRQLKAQVIGPFR